MNSFFKILVSILFSVTMLSCEKVKVDFKPEPILHDTIDIVNASDFLFNIPIQGNTIFMDNKYGIDFRLELEGYKIGSVEIKINDWKPNVFYSTIINSRSFFRLDGVHEIKFLLKTINLKTGDTIFFKTNNLALHVIGNLSQRFIKISDKGGRLNISWPELDKKNTRYYLIERYMGDNQEFKQEFTIADSTFIDNYYVGEKANYIISVINNEGKRQNIWNYYKDKEEPILSLSQDIENGYAIYFSRCRYYNNLGQIVLTTGLNANPELLFSSTSVADSTYHPTDATFAGEGRFWLRYLPKEFPHGVGLKDWQLYGHFLFAQYGAKSFSYDRIAVVDDKRLVFSKNGKIYNFDMDLGNTTDSIANINAKYELLTTTPAGKYVYATDRNINGSPIFVWPTKKFTDSPMFTFKTNFSTATISDNLVALMENQIPGTGGKLALFDVPTGGNIYTTPYGAYSIKPSLSSNGQYMFIYNTRLLLCGYSNSLLNVIWEESSFSKNYLFYTFDPVNTDICYLLDDDKNFFTNRVTDFSNIRSFKLDVEGIINIDYYSKKIMGYVYGKILIYNLSNGNLEKEIPANTGELFFWGNNSVLSGNTIYSNKGIKYEMKNK